MKPETIENLKQFDDALDLLMCVTEKYHDNIDNFAKRNSNNEIVKCKEPIIVDILPNKEIVLGKDPSSKTIKLSDSIAGVEIVAICQRSLFNFLKRNKEDENKTLDMLFNKIVNDKK